MDNEIAINMKLHKKPQNLKVTKTSEHPQKHGSFMIWFTIEGYYKQDLIFALNTLAGSDFLISLPAHFFCPETNRTNL